MRNAFTAAGSTMGEQAMDAKALDSEIFREADFISEPAQNRTAETKTQSPSNVASAIKKACGAFLNGQVPCAPTDF